MVSAAYAYWIDHPKDKVFIGKNFGSTRSLQILLTPLEWVGLNSVSDWVYKRQYKKILPRLNAEYLQNTLHLNSDDPAWKELETSGRIPIKKAVFEVKEALDYLKALACLHEFKNSSDFYPLLTPEEKKEMEKNPAPYLEQFRFLKLQSERSTHPEAFKRLVKGRFLDIDKDLLKKQAEWLKSGILPPDFTEALLAFVVERRRLIAEHPWVQSYFSPEVWFQITGSEPLSREGMNQLLALHRAVKMAESLHMEPKVLRASLCFVGENSPPSAFTESDFDKLYRLLEWHKRGILDLHTPLHWDHKELLYALYLDIERREGIDALARFTQALYKHPFFILDSLPLQCRLERLHMLVHDFPTTRVLDHPEVLKELHAHNFASVAKELEEIGGKDFAAFCFEGLSPDTKSCDSPLINDPYWPHIKEAESQIESIQEHLLIEKEARPRFHALLSEELRKRRKLPFEKDLLDRTVEAYLGQEYTQVKSICKIALPPKLDERLALLLPYARDKKGIIPLFTLYCHKRAAFYVQKDQNYSYTPALRDFINDLIPLLLPRSLPVTLLQVANVEKLLMHTLQLILDGQVEGSVLIHTLKKIECSLEKLSEDREASFFSLFTQKVKILTDKKRFLEEGAPPLKRFLWLSLIKALKDLAASATFSEDEMMTLNPHFELLEAKFIAPNGFHQTLTYFREQTPTHIFFWAISYLHNGTLEALLTKQVDEVVKQGRIMLMKIRADLVEAPLSDVISRYQEAPLSHFPEGFILPHISWLFDLIHRAKHFVKTNDDPPPLEIYILQNLSLLIKFVELVEGVKKTGALGKTLIGALSPYILQLTLPFCEKKESNALTALIGAAIPHLIHKHDFKPLIRTLKAYQKIMDAPEPLTLEAEKEFIREMTLFIDWIFDQILIYREKVPLFIRKLKRSFPS